MRRIGGLILVRAARDDDPIMEHLADEMLVATITGNGELWNTTAGEIERGMNIRELAAASARWN